MRAAVRGVAETGRWPTSGFGRLAGEGSARHGAAIFGDPRGAGDHDGQLETLDEVLWHYRETLRAPIGQTELRSLTLTNSQFEQLELFLPSLGGPIRVPARFPCPPGGE